MGVVQRSTKFERGVRLEKKRLKVVRRALETQARKELCLKKICIQIANRRSGVTRLDQNVVKQSATDLLRAYRAPKIS